jgi:hypothetical protein
MIQFEKDMPTIDVQFKPLSRHQRGEVMVEMFLQKVVDFEFVENAYTINSYLAPMPGKLVSPIIVEVKKKKRGPGRKRKIELDDTREEEASGENTEKQRPLNGDANRILFCKLLRFCTIFMFQCRSWSFFVIDF